MALVRMAPPTVYKSGRAFSMIADGYAWHRMRPELRNQFMAHKSFADYELVSRFAREQFVRCLTSLGFEVLTDPVVTRL